MDSKIAVKTADQTEKSKQVTRRELLKSAGVAAAGTLINGCIGRGNLFGTPQADSVSHRPNIIFIITDDQAYWALGAAGNPDAYTPNMDRLSGQGARLTNCFVTTPVCSPARAGFLSSRYSTEAGITDFIGERDVGLASAFEAWPRSLAQTGYDTALIGKWHLGERDHFHPKLFGYKEFTGFRWGGRTSKDPKLEVSGKVQKVKGHTVDILTDYALDFIRRKKDRPFMLSLHYWAPHASTIDYLKPRLGRHTWKPLPEQDWQRFKELEPKLPEPDYPNLNIPAAKRVMREYLASVSGVDRNLGRVLKVLDDLNLTTNTILIFTSDNGYNMGHHGISGKGNASWVVTDKRGERPNLFDSSLRIPALIRWPGVIKPQTIIDQTITNLDWFPTILAMASLKPPKCTTIHGRNFLPLLKGKKIKWDNELFAQYTMRGAGVMRAYRTKRWKLIRDFEQKIKDQLYDLTNDPDENNNLIDSGGAEIKSVRKLLNKELLAKMQSINDPVLSTSKMNNNFLFD